MEDDQKKSGGGITSESGSKDDLHSMNLEELHKLLNEVLEHEDYIKAIAIRDEIKSRGGTAS
jgi:protein-arginine kinase activator protein McsA